MLPGSASTLGEVPFVLSGTLIDNDEYANRRGLLMDELPDGATIIPGATSSITGDQFHHCRMKLVFIALGSRTTLEIGNIRAFFSDYQCALELAGI